MHAVLAEIATMCKEVANMTRKLILHTNAHFKYTSMCGTNTVLITDKTLVVTTL